ncbi:MAG: hypothetical protein IPO27_17535 [Bacteroidetes bacterium]|nr:hypothetical protein [Bacteroidota bacterium]
MGTDINVIADCNPATISCNNMTSSNRGINFNNASIVTGNNYYDNSTASDNTWNGDYLTNNNERISGGFNGGFPLDWYHQGDNVQGNMFAPLIIRMQFSISKCIKQRLPRKHSRQFSIKTSTKCCTQFGTVR